jgi:hypothetical protein
MEGHEDKEEIGVNYLFAACNNMSLNSDQKKLSLFPFGEFCVIVCYNGPGERQCMRPVNVVRLPDLGVES